MVEYRQTRGRGDAVRLNLSVQMTETVATFGVPISFVEAVLETKSQADDCHRVQQERM
jgi:hypothetical protein